MCSGCGVSRAATVIVWHPGIRSGDQEAAPASALCGFPVPGIGTYRLRRIYRKRYVCSMRPDLDLLADPARRLILALLWHEQELCVCEVEAATGLL